MKRGLRSMAGRKSFKKTWQENKSRKPQQVAHTNKIEIDIGRPQINVARKDLK